jgi:hypothetical protein
MSALVYLVTDSGSQSVSEIGQKLYPDLRSQLATVEKVTVRSGDNQSTIVNADGVWRVSDRLNYPASFEMISNLFDSLGSAKYLEKKTSRPENHARLGLSDPSAEGSEASVVKAFSGDQQLAALILGDTSSHLDGTYFRFENDDQVWLMDQTPRAVADPAEWLEPVIINIPEEDIDKVVQSNASGDQITIARESNESSNLVPEVIPKGKKLKYATVANQLGRALVNVNLEDVRAADEFDWSGANKTEFFGKNNLHLTVLSREHEGKYYLAFSSRPQRDEEPDETATELNARLAAWVFQVSEYTYEDFAKTEADLFEDEESDADEQSES